MNTGKILNMMKEARELFDSHDSNHDGKIEKKELKSILRVISQKLGLPYPTDNDFNNGFKELDKNNNDLLEFDEFIIFYKDVYDKIH